VNRDYWGTVVTYLGYFLLGLGMPVAFTIMVSSFIYFFLFFEIYFMQATIFIIHFNLRVIHIVKTTIMSIVYSDSV